jgi:hypothetical protein
MALQTLCRQQSFLGRKERAVPLRLSADKPISQIFGTWTAAYQCRFWVKSGIGVLRSLAAHAYSPRDVSQGFPNSIVKER